MTILEVMITLAIVGLMMMVGYMGLRSARQSDLREDTMKVAAALRIAQTTATQTGSHHRVVFDLDEQSFHLERCEGEIRLQRFDPGEEPTQKELQEKLEDRVSKSGETSELLEASSPKEATDTAAALAGVRVGAARCQPLTEEEIPFGGGMQGVRTDRGISIRNVYAQHVRGAADEGRVTINFFPLGTAEKAIVEVASEKSAYSLLVHRLSGRVALENGPLEEHVEYMEVNAAGNEEARR